MRILFYSDTHIRETGSFAPFNRIDPTTGLTYELLNILKGYDFLHDQIIKHNPNIVICGGDIVQTTEIQTTRVLHGMYLAHKKIKEACDKINAIHYMYPGNHDILSCHHGITSVGIMSGLFSEIFWEPIIKDAHDDDSTVFQFGYVPYHDDPIELNVQFRNMENKCDLIFCHQDFQGCNYGHDHFSTSPLSNKFKTTVISGDIHVVQTVGSVTYNGSLIQNVFAYDNLDRAGGCTLIDINKVDGENRIAIQSIMNNYSQHYIKVYKSSDVLAFKPTDAVFQVITEEDPQEIAKILEGYNYHYIPELKKRNEERKSYEYASLRNDPITMLSSYINANNPAAADLFMNILGKGSHAKTDNTP